MLAQSPFSMNDEPTLWSQVSEYIGAAVAGLVGIVWADNKRRVERVETLLDTKADTAEMNRQRDNITSVFDKLDDLKSQVHAMHVDILEKIK